MMGRQANPDPEADRSKRALPAEPPRPRPLLWPAVAFMVGIWLSETVGSTAGTIRVLVVLVAAGATVLVLVGPRMRAKWPGVVVGMVLVVAVCAGFGRHQLVINKPANHVAYLLGAQPLLTRLVGEVVTTPVSRPAERLNPFIPFKPPDRTRFVLAIRELRVTPEPVPIVGRVRVSVEAQGLELRVGERVELTGWLYAPRGPRNLGAFDWARWHYLQGIDAGLSVGGPEYVRRLTASGTPWRRLITIVRGYAQSLLLAPYAEVEADADARLLDTMILGQRGAANRELNEAFLRAGGLHFLAVSGFHVGVLVAAVWWVVRRLLRCHIRTAALAMLAVVLVYALIAEPRAPVLRAVVIAVLAALALWSQRPICILNSLAAAALVILVWNPLELFRPGFQLSFVQVLGLLTVAPRVYRLIVRRRGADESPPEAETFWQLVWLRGGRVLIGLATVCVVAWILALPLVTLHFERISPWGALGTFVLFLPVTVTIWLGFIAMALGPVLAPVAAVVGVCLKWATGGVLALVACFEDLPGTVVETRVPPVWLVVATYGAVLWLSTRGRQRGMTPGFVGRTWLIVVGVLLLMWGSWSWWPRHPARDDFLHVLAVGNGSAMVLSTTDGQAAVFDVGTDRNFDVGITMATTLRHLGIAELDTVCISHANFDHYSGVPTLLERVPVQRLYFNPYFEAAARESQAVEQFQQLASLNSVSHVEVAAGAWLAVGEVAIEVLWPPAGLDTSDWQANDRSLVLRLHLGGRTILLTGDIERAATRELLAAHEAGRVRLAADVLIAAHHGSVLKRDTVALLIAADPEVIVVSAGKPRPRFAALVARTLGSGCRLVNTNEVGAVTVRVAPEGLLLVETVSGTAARAPARPPN
ncbi:MAG: ComEC/Rec2 family competence protein [Planctomycetota bacterium]